MNRQLNISMITFTGKERDAETGCHAQFPSTRSTGACTVGARYYDSDLSGLFMSVDPMADKYPSISPYAYCAWNPVKLVDPDGCEIGDYYTEKGKKIGSDGEKDGKIYIVPFNNGSEIKI